MDRPRTEKDEELDERIEKIAENPPENLEDWPDDEAKYKTMGGPEGNSSYDEGPTAKLGPSGVRHHEDGSVTVDGEEVDDPEEFKGEPIPGGPTDPNAVDNPDEGRLEKDAPEGQESDGQ